MESHKNATSTALFANCSHGMIAVPSEQQFPRHALADKTRSKFKSRVVASECTHVHEASTCFATHGRGVRCVFKKEGRAISRNGLVFDDVCVLNAKLHGALTMLLPMSLGTSSIQQQVPS